MDDQIVAVFKKLEPKLEAEINGPVSLVRIKGPRWSYLAGKYPDTCSSPERVRLNNDYALLLFAFDGRPADSAKIINLFKAELT